MFVNNTSGSALVIVKPRTIDVEDLSRLTTPMASLVIAVTVGGTDRGGTQCDKVETYSLLHLTLTYNLHSLSLLM